MTRRIVSVALIAAPLAALLALLRNVAVEVETPVDLPRVAYASSRTCVICHPGRFETWHRTFHRTMTQRPGPGAVVGDFEDARLTYQGVTSRFTREGERYFIETLAPSGAMERYEVALTVGSRRVQQYVTRIGGRHVRLPLAWNIEERRWIHLNGAFLDADGMDFQAHRSGWDFSCIFCHNTKPRPRYQEAGDRFDPQVAELGIACEACHGPAELHVRRNADPLRRYFLHLGGRDPSIRSPAELSPERQIEVCGHCHGQRLPNPPQRIAEFLIAGDPYTAGEELGRFVEPITRDTKVPGLDLAPRFWNDGTPRLTAYEYQGLLLSKGHAGTDLTCTSCHDMHGGDPRGMIQEEMRGPRACLQCHEPIARDLRAHTHHAPEGAGSDCYACHMPRIAYGLLTVHPSHRITSPDPARAWRHQMPEACTLCHTDRTAAWAAAEAARQYPKIAPAAPPADEAYRWAESVRALFGGDVVQRAVAAEALSREPSYAGAAERLWAAPLLLVAMEDRVPAVRHIAHRGLVRLGRAAAEARPGPRAPPAEVFDYLAEAPARAAALERWWSWWRAAERSAIPHPGAALPLDRELMPLRAEIDRLVARQPREAVSIGE